MLIHTIDFQKQQQQQLTFLVWKAIDDDCWMIVGTKDFNTTSFETYWVKRAINLTEEIFLCETKRFELELLKEMLTFFINSIPCQWDKPRSSANFCVHDKISYKLSRSLANISAYLRCISLHFFYWIRRNEMKGMNCK